MSTQREAAALQLRDRIQTAANGHKLGVRVLFVGLQDIHPPVKVAPEYEKVVAATHQRHAQILAAEAEAIRTNAVALAAAFTITNRAEAARLDLEVTALARAAAFTNQLTAYLAAPSVYLERAYLQKFAQATAKVQKYVILATNTSADVIQWDLQRRLDDEYFQKISGQIGAPKN
jgi:regulator of protease activity HflC (stomatin/prohibitin superfamily)